MTRKELEIKAKEFDSKLKRHPMSSEELQKVLCDFVEALRQPPGSGGAWEHKLIGKNIHSVFTWCKDCHSEGVNIPFNDECGNCSSKNTVRYYDKETIDLLF
jgi:hypothetical protein